MHQQTTSKVTKVVVATTVMLAFISFWRAAAIVLCDLASSAYYAGGLAEGFVGKSAPWFILVIMLFSYAVRAVYIESCSMFVRGGVYRVVREALGRILAKFSVSALMFDYVLTGPISGVSAGLYLAGLINEIADLLHAPGFTVHPPYFAALFTILITLYFWRKNIIGIHESSKKALRIMQATTIMVVILIVWRLATMLQRGFNPIPFPTMSNIRFSADAVGWLQGTWVTHITFFAILIGLGHSVLAMSGEESLAQVNREIAFPKLKNLERAGLVIFIYSMLFTSLVSFFAVMLIPDNERAAKHVELVVVPERDYNRATVDVAQQLQSSLVVMGLSAKMSPSEQAKAFGDAWELLPHPRPQLSLEILDQQNQKQLFFNLGPHPPRLWPEDVEFLHQLWREISELGLGHKLHHRDVVRVALKRLGADLRSAELHQVLAEIRKEVSDERNLEGNVALFSDFVGSRTTG